MICFASAGAVFEARPIAAIPAGCLAEGEITAKPNVDIDRPKKAKKPTGRPKIAVGMG